MTPEDEDTAPPGAGKRISPRHYDAAVFDLDGVITRTAAVHARAWKAMFDAFLEDFGGADGDAVPAPFDADRDYRRHVDGKPRYDGVRDFLAARGITLPDGDPDDPPERRTVCGLGNRKNQIFREQLERDGVDVFSSSVDLVRALGDAGIATAVVSSSRNCQAVLDAAGIGGLFQARVDGNDLQRLGLPGKPAPDMFLEAARRLSVEPARCVGVEDALAGVEAIRAARFGLVVGVDRSGNAAALYAHGADIVVPDLALLEVADTENRQRVRELPNALDHIDEVLSDGRRPALFLDYDGTLTPIVRHPDEANLSESMRSVLARLGQQCPLAIISGRDLADVRRRVGVAGIWYAGSHGFDIQGPDGAHSAHQRGTEYLPDLDAAENDLRDALQSVPGALVERKRFSIAVHYRNVAAAAHDSVERLIEEVHARHARLRLSGGKKIHELRPGIPWDKGKALEWLLRRQGLVGDDVVPLYIGDDTTDEDAFSALDKAGVGIIVSPTPGRTRADYRLDDPDAVRRFLDGLSGRLSEQADART